MQLPSLDYSALKAGPRTLSRAQQYGVAIGIVVVGALLIIALLKSNTTVGATVLYAGVFGILAGGTIWAAVQQRWQNAMLEKFALVNSLHLEIQVRDPWYNGLFFQIGKDRLLTQIITVPTDSTPVEVGNYRYITGDGRSRRRHDVGFVHIKLPRRLPNIVLDAKSNNPLRVSNLPEDFNRNQILPLEGDFDDYFTLYVPREYQQDALYIFTPDVMAALVDHARNFDIEIVDDDLYLYASSKLELATQSTWRLLFRLLSEIMPEIDQQTNRYADNRVASPISNTIAIPGQRLRTNASSLALAAVVIIVLVFFFEAALPLLINRH